MNKNYMVQSGEILDVITPIIYASGLDWILLPVLPFSSMKKSLLTQNLQQSYTTTTLSLFIAFTCKEYLKMPQEGPIVSQYYSWAGGPKHYYIIIQTFDMFEYLFRLYKTDMIEVRKWLRWKTTATSMITIPKFKKVWDETKESRSHEFAKFVDSL
jgi:hypothetical protein